MTRFLIYVFPALIDAILGGMFLIGPVRLARSDQGFSKTAVGGSISAWAIAYTITARFLGRRITPQNSAGVLIGSVIALAGCCGAFVWLPGEITLYVLMAVVGWASACFFVPFQIFMKAVDGGRSSRGVVRPCALYTFSWSMGLGVGALVAGWVWHTWSWQWCYALNAAMALVTAGGILLLKHHAHTHHHAEADMAPPTADLSAKRPNYAGMPDLAWVGWIIGGIGCLTLQMVRGVLPSSGELYRISEDEQGVVIGLLCAVQAVVGLSFFWGRVWMFRVAPMLLFGVFGVTGLILFAFARTAPMFYVAGVCCGIHAGAFFYYQTFHSLTHPRHASRYVGVTEAVVGAAGIVGPLLGGVIADMLGLTAPYLLAAGLLGAAVVFQAAMHMRSARAVNACCSG